MEQRSIEFLLRYRYWLALISVLFTFLIAAGAKNLYFEADYKIFFEKDDPLLLAHEQMQGRYTKTDNFVILLRPSSGDIFTAESLKIVHEITELAWQTPYAIRVDSLTNYQSTTADGDDLLVEDLVLEPADLNAQKVAAVKAVALNEQDLINRLFTKDNSSAIIVVSLELPQAAEPGDDELTQVEKRVARDNAFPQIVGYGRGIVEDFQATYPGLEMHLAGVAMINNTFNESSANDMKLLVPVMYMLILVTLAIVLRSFGGLVVSFILIGFSSMVGMGAAGWIGYAVNTVNIIAPTIIMTIAVCDSVHLLIVYLRGLSQGLSVEEAMRESLRINLQPIFLTSITTAVGFLTLNFSISPPFAQFGNITAIGVLWAMLLTFTLVPPLAMLFMRKSRLSPQKKPFMHGFVSVVLNNRRSVFIVTAAITVALVSMIPKNVIDDDPIGYFKPGIDFRDASDFQIEQGLGVNDINLSFDCGVPGCVNDIEFLRKLDEYVAWVEQQPEVVSVFDYTKVVKRLNRSMNGDLPAEYRLPPSSDLAAQYNLMYEMSLSYGLDLFNQINIDKSATRVSFFTKQISSSEFLKVEDRSRQWLRDNHPELETPGAGVSIMFSHVGERNIRSMLWGGVIAILAVTLTIFVFLRSFRYALISMIPNSFPALMAFGIWGLLNGVVNQSVAAVFSISLGIVVDDTVHFISKYRRARESRNMSKEEAIYYAFDNVGPALVATTLVLVLGFSVLTLSDFNLNAQSGMLTAITIAIALVFDFLMLPLILMFGDKDEQHPA